MDRASKDFTKKNVKAMANATLSAIQEVKIPSNEAEAAAEGARLAAYVA